MGQLTKIEWADHTFNPWIGCTAVSPACDNCYAEAFAKRTGGPSWGKGQPRRLTSDANWRKPLAWNRKAAKEGRRYRVFCASLADVFDAEVPDEWRDRLFALIAVTPHLDWLLLTKRLKVAHDYLTGPVRTPPTGMHDPYNTRRHVLSETYVAQRMDQMFKGGRPLPNVWLGTTVENQAMAEVRIPLLLDTPAAVRFLSCEPLLGPVDLPVLPDWVIAGGESGPRARPSHPDWFRSLRDQCAAADVPFFFKQWGEWVPPQQGQHFDTALGRVGRPPAFIVSASDGTTHCFHGDHILNGKPMVRLGKKKAGRTLDGRIHDAVPETPPCAACCPPPRRRRPEGRPLTPVSAHTAHALDAAVSGRCSEAAAQRRVIETWNSERE